MRPMTFRQRIIEVKNKRGLSMYDLARLTGVPRTTLQSYLVDGRDIGSGHLERILASLKIGPVWLR